MFVNFLHPNLNPSVESDIVCSEGFELHNLISSNIHRSEAGFLAERFISGPVTFRLKFICSIHVKYVIIWPQVGSQKSFGFELSVINDPNDCARFASGTIPSCNNGIIFHREGTRINYDILSSEVKSFASSTFFRNKLYDNVSIMQVKIYKSHFVPAIKKIEVWGEPHRSCDVKTQTLVRKLWSNIRSSGNVSEDAMRTSAIVHACDILNERCPQLNNLSIPEEFYDQITHEVMTLPMILPSGKIIDNCTLQKFQAEEAKWGRLPNDPFTSVPFTDRNKPIIATALKSNIDSFLLKYSDSVDLKYLPRRLGSQDEKFVSSSFRVSKIVEYENNKRRHDERNDNSEHKVRKISEVDERINDPSNINDRDDDIHKMLQKTLHNLPSFITCRPNESKDVTKCQRCFHITNLYKLPCFHVLCRLCLSSIENYCVNCKKKFSCGEIQKIHSNTSHVKL